MPQDFADFLIVKAQLACRRNLGLEFGGQHEYAD
jgi:hypothetical protein